MRSRFGLTLQQQQPPPLVVVVVSVGVLAGTPPDSSCDDITRYQRMGCVWGERQGAEIIFQSLNASLIHSLVVVVLIITKPNLGALTRLTLATGILKWQTLVVVLVVAVVVVVVVGGGGGGPKGTVGPRTLMVQYSREGRGGIEFG